MYDLTLAATELGPLLVGAFVSAGGVTVQLTEVEAYAGADDPAAHAYPGPRPRTRDLFGPPGTLYCYLSHGLHICGNVVCGRTGEGSAVLLRAGRVVEGVELARERRPGVADVALARGPGNLGRALGWSLADSGRTFGAGGLELRPGPPSGTVASGPRVGVSVAHARPWRYWAEGDPTVSAYRRSPRIVPGRHDW
ncbi:MAG: DNA-3-methyladenine glycosylase [Propionicimonas sp.]|uniref:DNA-3-methyladenine glycosylase n=1 Tax=Propionicimonas sp. TaxID=1955623 RepID=UPI003D112CD0